jgi:hypothetical protein
MNVCHMNVCVGPENGCTAGHTNACVGPKNLRCTGHRNVCVGPQRGRSSELAIKQRLNESIEARMSPYASVACRSSFAPCITSCGLVL